MPILQDCIDSHDIKVYYEPFVGGANLIDKIKCPCKIGNDIHPQLIAMFKALQNGWVPPEHISEEEYIRVRDNRGQYPDYYVGYVGFNASFGAGYFEGYARGFKNDGVTPRDLSNEAYRNLMKQLPDLMDIEFRCGSFIQWDGFLNAAIYCDPPYENTKKYSTGNFDYELFWEWCRQTGKQNFVFISSYDAPDDFECIWSRKIQTPLDSKRKAGSEKNIRCEKLFVPKRE